MILRLILALAFAAGAVGGTATPTMASHPMPSVTVAQSNLVIPWDVAFAPDGRMFVTERPGRIRVYASGAPGAPEVSVTTIEHIRAEHESGANGVAIDRDFATHPFLYVCAARDADGAAGPAPWMNELLRYRVNPNGTLGAYSVILTGALANTQHNGCPVEMDASGFLWIGIGDGGVAGLAQDPNSLNGKVLRIGRDGSIPTDNPILPGAAGRTAVYSMGHRNPQGVAFEPGTGAVYAVEHGPSVNDEMNVIVAGGNYGWPCYTGASTQHATDPACGPASAYLPPVWASGGVTIATSGMTFVDHPLWGEWSGSALVSQLKDQDLRRFTKAGAGPAMQESGRFFDGDFGRLRAAVHAPDGALYLTTSNGTGDRILRVVPGDVRVDRYHGPNRYATAAQVSANTFAPGVPTVYVATGANYPDALAGGAAAARERGPVLLVTRNSIPAATGTELARLRPNRIVVLGGTEAISTGVEQALADFAPAGTVRLAGADRYATAAAISRSTFAPGAPVAYVATGRNYPDALAGVPAAGIGNGPILLVNATGVPAPTVRELQRLAPQRIVVLGGVGVIPTKVVNTLQGFTSSAVERRAGDDRYATAVAISRATFGAGVPRVFIATGSNFPDGLTGGPAAALAGGPLLLVPGTSVPAAVRDELLRLDPAHVILLGGPDVLSDAVAAEISALLNP